ncbi:optineurin-like isoform X3 [Dreissena polymorpha]|uniref:CCHC NOA-type domain-containing protein n=1 Tax=Dreissena polymorpha TaxID=45954 RepID=A0A9D4GM77_DREPO|nr:optineurin-like isoform X3 [Dreissena polymorpha]KAH3819413.1 hypothetical protein DPMN_121147 [Dreissena polymorpha]
MSMNGGLPAPSFIYGPQPTGYQPGGLGSQHGSSSSGSSYTILSSPSGSSYLPGGGAVLPGGYIQGPSLPHAISMTDITLEQAMAKVQELGKENAALREYLKENNTNMKKQFQVLLEWKEKVKDSNQQNLTRFERLQREIAILRSEKEKYKQYVTSPDTQAQGCVLESLQVHIRRLETEKFSTQHEIASLRSQIDSLKQKLQSSSDDMVVANGVDDRELEAYKRRCNDLNQQVQHYQQQNEQLMSDLQQVKGHKEEIQIENSKLNSDNLAMQKRLQELLGDMSKTKFSLSALKEPATTQYMYGGGVTEGAVAEGTEFSTEKTDMEVLALQCSADMMAHLDHVKARKSALAKTSQSSELQLKLQEERQKASQQMHMLSNQELEISRLRGQLGEKEQMLTHYKEQLDSQLENVTLEHQRQREDLLKQLDHLNSELKHTKYTQPHSGDVQSLKSQVMSLIQEVQEQSSKLDMASKTIDKKSARIMELEEHIRVREQQYMQAQQEFENYVRNLKANLAISEDTINKERMEHATSKKNLMEFRASFNQLVSDYKELLDTFDEYKANVQNQPAGASGPQSRQQLEEINRLTAQTIAAEEAITYREEQIKELKAEIGRLRDEVDNTIPVLRAQADVWKQDFDAERFARERQVEEKENLIQEMKNLELKNQQLLDELENYSRKSLAEMQRRHASPSHQQQLQSHLKVGNQTGPHRSQSPQNVLYGARSQQGSPRPGAQSPAGSHGQPVEHGQEDNMGATNVGSVNQLPPQAHSQSSAGSSGQDEDENQKCPKCDKWCPDMDSLQIHVIECLDN